MAMMNDKITYSVYETTNYGKFKFLDRNRPINKLHIKKLAEQIREKRYHIPILVNEKFEVIDGQHRLVALEYLGLPVHYIMQPRLDENDVPTINISQKKMSIKNFVEALANAGDKNASKIIEAHKKYKINFNSCLEIYGYNLHKLTNVKSVNKEVMTYGTIRIPEEELSNRFFQVIQTIASNRIHEEKIIKGQPFIRTTLMLLNEVEKFDLLNFATSVMRTTRPLILSSNTRQNSILFNEIYNYGVRKDKRVNCVLI